MNEHAWGHYIWLVPKWRDYTIALTEYIEPWIGADRDLCTCIIVKIPNG
jgi:hypothetical protein